MDDAHTFSTTSIFQANNDFKKHTQNVVEMKKDLESIFRLPLKKHNIKKHFRTSELFIQEIEDYQAEAEQTDARCLRGGDGVWGGGEGGG